MDEMARIDAIRSLLDIAKRKSQFDITNNWAQGSKTYLDEIRKEISEVEDEIPLNRRCYLEDELGDVLWDYLNILFSLEKEERISVLRVFERAAKKYEERISGLEAGLLWADIKVRQKEKLAEEHRDEVDAKQ